jgi:hypothetical protein
MWWALVQYSLLQSTAKQHYDQDDAMAIEPPFSAVTDQATFPTASSSLPLPLLDSLAALSFKASSDSDEVPRRRRPWVPCTTRITSGKKT